MKLRQKLAMVLAAAMVVTAVPVTTMAASTNGLNQTISLIEGTEVTSNSGLFLNMEFTTDAAAQVFYLEGSDFEFNKKEYLLLVKNTEVMDAQDAVNAAKAAVKSAQAVVDGLTEDAKEEQKKDAQDKLEAAKKDLEKKQENLKTAVKEADEPIRYTKDGVALDITVQNAKRLQVKVASNTEDVENKIAIPILGTAKKGTPAIIVDGVDSTATSGKYVISSGEVVTDKALVATVDGDPLNIAIDGKGEIGNIKIEEAVAGALSGQTITIELSNKAGLKFKPDMKATDFEVEGFRGLNSVKTAATVKLEDEHTLKITFPKNSEKTRGGVILKGIDVVAEDAKEGANTGEVKVTVTGDKVAETKLHVANVTDFGLELKAKEAVELTAGKETEKVTIEFNELAAGSINDRRDVFFKIEGAHVVDFTTKTFKDKDNNPIAKLTYDQKDEEFTLSFEDKFSDEVINKFAFEVELYADVDYAGEVKVVASSRDFDDMEAVIGEVTATTTATTKETVVKVGLNSQVGGEIELKEETAETFAKGKEVIVKLAEDAQEDGIKVKNAKVEVTAGDVVIDEDSITVKDGEIRFKIKRASDEASTIKISEIELDVNRLTPEGNYAVVIGGAALSDRNAVENKKDDKNIDERLVDTIEVEKFIVVGTKNTEDLPDAAKAKEIILTVDSTAYTVNGEAKTADAAPFINSNNRTMVPVKFVAEEFGKIQFGTVNGVGTVTIFKDGSVLQFQNGSNIMNKNGINIPMDTKVVIQDGRTYVPFKYVADGLGIGYTYDAANKSITFTNQAK